MTRLAFGSCCRYEKDHDQKVWGHIQGQASDHVLLVGDQIYMDFGLPIFGGNLNAPRNMTDQQFADAMYKNYKTQFEIPSFQRLVQSLPAGCIHCTWDDHDFAWNNAVGGTADDDHQVPAPKRRASRILFDQFRRSLEARLPAYPAIPNWSAPGDMGGVHSSFAVAGVRVILLDLRTWADAKQEELEAVQHARALPAREAELLGPVDGPQQRWLDQQLALAEQEIVLCSSLTLTKGTSWSDYPAAFDRLLRRLSGKKVLVLSGDIHVNALKTHANPHGPLPVYEATCSGLAITGYKFGYSGALSNSGLVDISPNEIRVALFRDADSPDGALLIDRQKWQSRPG